MDNTAAGFYMPSDKVDGGLADVGLPKTERRHRMKRGSAGAGKEPLSVSGITDSYLGNHFLGRRTLMAKMSFQREVSHDEASLRFGFASPAFLPLPARCGADRSH